MKKLLFLYIFIFAHYVVLISSYSLQDEMQAYCKISQNYKQYPWQTAQKGSNFIFYETKNNPMSEQCLDLSKELVKIWQSSIGSFMAVYNDEVEQSGDNLLHVRLFGHGSKVKHMAIVLNQKQMSRLKLDSSDFLLYKDDICDQFEENCMSVPYLYPATLLYARQNSLPSSFIESELQGQKDEVKESGSRRQRNEQSLKNT